MSIYNRKIPSKIQIEKELNENNNWGRWGDKSSRGAINLITEQKINPSNLLVLSFSNAAIKELKDRIEIRSNINVNSIKLSNSDLIFSFNHFCK